ncbi:MAG: hypothetical protein LBQ36_00525, partial [Synergistaceae bacterium]|nr:hypothetical protein [Synergistaceae bacterium]
MKLIAYDLGTGGVKAALYDESLRPLAKSFMEYETFYPGPGRHEQRPEDWWSGVALSTATLLRKSGIDGSEIGGVALSGQSLVAAPLDSQNRLLLDRVPIWSDMRAVEESREFFSKIDLKEWYMTTGNGFPPPCYSIFKLMWLRRHQPDVFGRMDKVLGSKDYINFRMTGKLFIDHSYASGTGGYNLREGRMEGRFWEAAGLPMSIFPDIVPSHTVIGNMTEEAAEELGLSTKTKVACGGVDNACMALGAVGAGEGRAYTSLGSSSWIPVNSSIPILDYEKKPYVFAHIAEGLFTSAFSIFSGGSSLRWVREVICKDIEDDGAAYRIMDDMAAKSPPGAGGLIFNPSLAGGTSQDGSIYIKGAYLGLRLGTTREDMIRAALEGIALNLKMSYDFMKERAPLEDRLMICGGGGKSPFWLQMFADVFGVEIIKTNVDQDAAALGAAAIAARALGLWRDYAPLDEMRAVERSYVPDEKNSLLYKKTLKVFRRTAAVIAELGDYM